MEERPYDDDKCTILIIEDDNTRKDIFRKIFGNDFNLYFCSTSDSLFELLESGIYFSGVFFDYDLEDSEFTGKDAAIAFRTYTYHAVFVLIHSWNTVGAGNIHNELLKAGKHMYDSITVEPFDVDKLREYHKYLMELCK